MSKTNTIRVEIKNRWTGESQFACDLESIAGETEGERLGRAVKEAVKTRANLAGANLADANLARAKDADLAIAMTRILPEGDLIGWKKCQDGVIVKVRIPAEAKRSHAFGRKCRAEFADVLEVIGAEVDISQHDEKTEYRAGERVTPDGFDPNWMNECAQGVHFYITKAEAEAH